MKKLLFIIAILPFVTFGQGNGSLRVVVTNLKSTEGSVLVALFNSEDSFLDDEWKAKKVSINNMEEVIVEFTDIPQGVYGISVFHDENENDELDTNFMGIPKEPFGFGNDAMGAFGPPGFDKASVEVGEGVQTTYVKLKNF
jgi:uncharacterized protein (DUF2141 family)